eukprot:6214152-Pleurochrysis_carterae.AAC.1
MSIVYLAAWLVCSSAPKMQRFDAAAGVHFSHELVRCSSFFCRLRKASPCRASEAGRLSYVYMRIAISHNGK